jgi:uncharacterized ion transporter superfamily protein YfcC
MTSARHVLLGIISIPLALIAWPLLAVGIVALLAWEILRLFGEGFEKLLIAALAIAMARGARRPKGSGPSGLPSAGPEDIANA